MLRLADPALPVPRGAGGKLRVGGKRKGNLLEGVAQVDGAVEVFGAVTDIAAIFVRQADVVQCIQLEQENRVVDVGPGRLALLFDVAVSLLEMKLLMNDEDDALSLPPP